MTSDRPPSDAGSLSGRCPLCRDPLDATPIVTCDVCETALHAACREYLGGCARFACTAAATPRGRLVEYLAANLELRLMNYGALAAIIFGMFAAHQAGYLRTRNSVYAWMMHPLAQPLWLAFFAFQLIPTVRGRRTLELNPSYEALRTIYQSIKRLGPVSVLPELPGFFRWLLVPFLGLGGLLMIYKGDLAQGLPILSAAALFFTYFRFQDRLHEAMNRTNRLHHLWSAEFEHSESDQTKLSKSGKG
jgi:hypothetical protein